MTLVDTSAWIEFFRPRGDPEYKERVAVLVRNGLAAYTCPVYYELLVGARRSEVSDIEAVLEESTRVYFVRTHWDSAALLGRELRAAGVTVPGNDLLVATLSIAERMRILCKDEHFHRMKGVFNDRLQLEATA